MSGYSIQPIYGLITRYVLKDGLLAGFLYEPKQPGGEWEVWPASQDDFGRLPDGNQGCVPRKFRTMGDALRFLGIDEPSQVAA